MAFDYQGVKIAWLGHDGFRISNSSIIYIDPLKIKPSVTADLLLITHNHHDHLNLEDIRKIAGEKTTIIAAYECRDRLKGLRIKELRTAKPGDKLSVGNVSVEAVPAYNVNKFRAPGQPFHPKQDGKVGYIVGIGSVRIYHAGDTDHIPEMNQVKADVALLPVSGTYVMTAEEAAEATKALRPKVAVPMHYGGEVGTEADAKKFAELAACEVMILKPE
jgi:L-ascorbate metabolism protein UlaG (beta-lactamase superfamily)